MEKTQTTNLDDKRLILLAVDYLINLQSDAYAKEMVTHIESLGMKREEKEMYVSIFERVYTARGKEEGRMEGRMEGRADIAKRMLSKGLTVNEVAEYTDLPREEIEAIL